MAGVKTLDPRIQKSIVSWFSRVRVASMKLPSGWFGRPRDAFHKLTHCATLHRKLIIELDEQLLLVLTDVENATVSSHPEQNEEWLTLSGFSNFVFDRLEYVSMAPRTEVFESGEVTFVHMLPIVRST